jgi:hypothetical protein
MKLLIAVITVLALGAAAMAEPDPVGRHEFMPSPTVAAIDFDTGAQTREADYFRAPRIPSADERNKACRLRILFSAKPILLARSCP